MERSKGSGRLRSVRTSEFWKTSNLWRSSSAVMIVVLLLLLSLSLSLLPHVLLRYHCVHVQVCLLLHEVHQQFAIVWYQTSHGLWWLSTAVQAASGKGSQRVRSSWRSFAHYLFIPSALSSYQSPVSQSYSTSVIFVIVILILIVFCRLLGVLY